MNDLETGIDIRNERMRNFVFETDVLPTAYIISDIDLATLASMNVGESQTETLLAELVLHGVSQELG